jgi:hypothetical protein
VLERTREEELRRRIAEERLAIARDFTTASPTPWR